jgi:hypothetical protein
MNMFRKHFLLFLMNWSINFIQAGPLSFFAVVCLLAPLSSDLIQVSPGLHTLKQEGPSFTQN